MYIGTVHRSQEIGEEQSYLHKDRGKFQDDLAQERVVLLKTGRDKAMISRTIRGVEHQQGDVQDQEIGEGQSSWKRVFW